MKKRHITLTIVLLLVIASLNCCPKEDGQAIKNKAVVMRSFEIMNSREYDKLDEVYAQDFRRYCQATPEARVESLEDFKALINEWDRQIPDGVYEILQIAAEGDLVAYYVTYSGTNEGPIGQFPATGKKMTAECIGFYRLENDKIVETWVTWDNLAVLGQLGLFPPPASE